MAILSVKGVNKRFGGLQALGDVNLDVVENTCHAIIGPNGAGKSTLLNVLVGKLIPDSGSVVFDGQSVNFNITTLPMDEVLRQSDFITLHIPAQKQYIIGKSQFDLMKNGTGIINAARGGVINEVELIDALESGKIAFAGLDTFEQEPNPAIQVLMNGRISLTPHIGAATNEAQDRIGTELASQIISILKTKKP